MVIIIPYPMLSIRFRFSTRIVTSETDVLKLFRKYYSWKPKRIYAFYNSQFDKIITQQHLMLMPIDERIATRAHAASNVLSIRNQKIINMQAHIQKLIDQAKSLAIQPCLKQDALEKKILDTVKAAFQSYLHQNTRQDLQKEVFALKIILSSGHGDFGIAARDNGCVFYATVYQPLFDSEDKGIKEYVTRVVNSSIREYLPHQTVNEVENAMMANQAKKRGGFAGIKCTKDGTILESSVGNLGFVFQGCQFVTPRVQTVMPTSTLKEVLKHLRQNGERYGVTTVVERDVTVQQAEKAQQIMVFGKDRIVPVLSLNDHAISDAKGPITAKLQSWYQQFVEKGTVVEV